MKRHKVIGFICTCVTQILTLLRIVKRNQSTSIISNLSLGSTYFNDYLNMPLICNYE